MGNSLDELSSYFRPLAKQLLSDAAKQGLPCRIVSCLRTPSEQDQKIRDGVSWTTRSKHLPQPSESLSEAIDIVPLEILHENKKNWSPDSSLWQRLGPIGEALGLRWGGRWTTHPDPSHFEMIHTMVVTDPDIDHK